MAQHRRHIGPLLHHLVAANAAWLAFCTATVSAQKMVGFGAHWTWYVALFWHALGFGAALLFGDAVERHIEQCEHAGL